MAFWNKRKPVEPIIPAVHVDWEAKFKLAATDLAAQAEELNQAKLHIDHLGITFNQRLADEVQDYQADALLWRAARDKRSRDRKAAKAGVVS